MKLSKSVMKLHEHDGGLGLARVSPVCSIPGREDAKSSPNPVESPGKVPGFTLIELLIALAIIGVLVTFAWPRYQDYLHDTRQAQAVADMMACALSLERYYSANFTYAGASEAGTCKLSSPTEGTARYTISYQQLSATDFTLRATPVGGACGTGDCIELKSDGSRHVL